MVQFECPKYQMGMEVLEGLCVSQSQQRPLSRKVNKRINSHPVRNHEGGRDGLDCWPTEEVCQNFGRIKHRHTLRLHLLLLFHQHLMLHE